MQDAKKKRCGQRKGDKRAGEESVSHNFYSERPVVKELQGTIL